MMRHSVDLTRRKYHSLAVSGECSSGKSTLCGILSQYLSWPHVDIGSEFRRIAKLRGLSIEAFGSIPDPLLRQIDKQIQHRMKTEVGKVWDGRLTCYLARNNTTIFKIHCLADFDVRAERLANRNKISLEEAKRKVLARDKEEADVFERLYGVSNPYSKRWENLHLDTSCNSPEELAKVVLQAFSSS
jgi:cytidylate kinase